MSQLIFISKTSCVFCTFLNMMCSVLFPIKHALSQPTNQPNKQTKSVHGSEENKYLHGNSAKPLHQSSGLEKDYWCLCTPWRLIIGQEWEGQSVLYSAFLTRPLLTHMPRSGLVSIYSQICFCVSFAFCSQYQLLSLMSAS